jgi:hypothetical protein
MDARRIASKNSGHENGGFSLLQLWATGRPEAPITEGNEKNQCEISLEN